MNTKTLSTYVLSSLIIFSVIFAACSASNKDFTMTQPDPVVEILGTDFDAADLVSGELDAGDISAARQAAHYLSASRRVLGELDTVDIADARQAAQYLSNIRSANNAFDISDYRLIQIESGFWARAASLTNNSV